MPGDVPLAIGSLLAVASILVLRLSWGRKARSSGFNAAGWLMLGAAQICGALAAGAWGMSVVALWAMATALVLVAIAGWQSPAKPARASNRRVGMVPETGEQLRLGGRILTFVLVALLSLASSIALALFVRWVALCLGAHEANASVMALFTTPLAWTFLAHALLMTENRQRQFAMLGLTLASAFPPLLAGAFA